VIAFAAKDDDGQEVAAIAKLCDYASNTLISRFTPERTEIDSVYDLRAVFQTGHRDMKLDALPPLLCGRN